MKSSSDGLHYCKSERWLNWGRALAPFLFFSLGATLLLSFFIRYSPNMFKTTEKRHLDVDHHTNNALVQSLNGEEEKCNLFEGHWIEDLNASQYTNTSCLSIPDSKNCFKNGRPDADFLKWRWKPDQCELPRFDPKTFLGIVRGKKMAFVGDSVARNHVDSLICLLSKEEILTNIHKDTLDRFRTWYFPHYDFTIIVLWSPFLVSHKERVINGSKSGVFDLNLDKVDEKWTRKIAATGIDYVVISDGHWLFRKLYLHKGGAILGCVDCEEQNVTDQGVEFALRMIFRAALSFINECKTCKSSVTTFLRTFAPDHFENGTWTTGGSCKRSSPMHDESIFGSAADYLQVRNIQVEEIERARKQQGKGCMKKFEVFDVTKAMFLRPDGHPGSYWGGKLINDCLHWCLPGPIDALSEFLMALLLRLNNISDSQP